MLEEQQQIAITMIDEITQSSKRRFTLMIIGAITIALMLVLVSMDLYNSSGAAQLDLSRPGYNSVRSQAKNDDGDIKYSSIGTIDQGTIDNFQELYTKQAAKVNAANAFGGDPLSAKSLGLIEEASK